MTTTDVRIEPVPEGIRIVEEALALAVSGDLDGGKAAVVPLISAGSGSAFSLAGMLAEVAAFTALRQPRPGSAEFGTLVVNERTGRTASTEVLPPALAWAAAFLTAWANRDFDTAEAHFKAVCNIPGTDGSHLLDGVLTLFELAVLTAEHVTAERRRRLA